MAAETGHHPNRVYTDQDGNFHLNGASIFDAGEVDMKGYMTFRGGVAVNSTNGLTDVVTGLNGILAAWAAPIATAQSTAAGIPAYCKVGFTTGSGTLQILAVKPSATAIDHIAATSTGVSLSWIAMGI